MIVVSTLVMFGLMYLNTHAMDHIFFSENRAYMALIMGAAMAVIMLAFMLQMYKNGRANLFIFIGAALVFAGALWLVRSQATVKDVSWMEAMIPHHSIAILTSERANLSDPRVRKLADGIIETQRCEIAEMKALIDDLDQRREHVRGLTRAAATCGCRLRGEGAERSATRCGCGGRRSERNSRAALPLQMFTHATFE
jgi:hypothetical protein